MHGVIGDNQRHKSPAMTDLAAAFNRMHNAINCSVKVRKTDPAGKESDNLATV